LVDFNAFDAFAGLDGNLGADLGRLVDLEFRDPLDATVDFPPPTLPPLVEDFNAFDGLEAFDALEALEGLDDLEALRTQTY
jgi:hypothetical protein